MGEVAAAVALLSRLSTRNAHVCCPSHLPCAAQYPSSLFPQHSFHPSPHPPYFPYLSPLAPFTYPASVLPFPSPPVKSRLALTPL